MKHYITLMLFLTTLTYGCPTCIGRLDKQSPPFFSNEQYQPTKNKKQKNKPAKNTSNYRKKRGQ